jgi:choline dehydrogenase-like flavoprotein
MSHLAFQEPGREHELTVDYVVVGSGAGGATAAVTLARGGAEVAIVEAGPWRDPDDYPCSVYGAMRDMLEEWGASFTQGRAFWPLVKASLVGGSTVVNSAICVRTPGDVFERWQKEHGVGGETMARALWEIEDELDAELGAEEPAANALGRSELLIALAARRQGIEHHYTRRYAPGCLGTGQCLQGCRAGKKQSLNVNFVPEVLARGGHVLSCAPAGRIRWQGRRAIGVEGRFRHPQSRARGARFFVQARKGVLVAASVTHSPLLLMRSGVRLPALGQFFRSHPGTPMLGLYDEPVDMNRGTTQGWSSLAYREQGGFKLETIGLPLDMLAGRLSGGGRQLMQRLSEFRHLAVWANATRAESTGTIRPDLLGRPSVHYTLDRADMLRLRLGLVTLARMHFLAGARAVVPAVHGLPYELGPDQLHVLEQGPLDPRAYVAILSHLFGGCVMGSDPSRSVCDAGGRVHGYDALHVVDASAIPSNLGVNPQHTIMALARLWSRQLLDA